MLHAHETPTGQTDPAFELENKLIRAADRAALETWLSTALLGHWSLQETAQSDSSTADVRSRCEAVRVDSFVAVPGSRPRRGGGLLYRLVLPVPKAATEGEFGLRELAAEVRGMVQA